MPSKDVPFWHKPSRRFLCPRRDIVIHSSHPVLELYCCRNVVGFVDERPDATDSPFVDEEESWEGRTPVIDPQIDCFAVVFCIIGGATKIDKYKFSFLISNKWRAAVGQDPHTWGSKRMKKEYSLKALRWSRHINMKFRDSWKTDFASYGMKLFSSSSSHCCT